MVSMDRYKHGFMLDLLKETVPSDYRIGILGYKNDGSLVSILRVNDVNVDTLRQLVIAQPTESIIMSDDKETVHKLAAALTSLGIKCHIIVVKGDVYSYD